MIVRTVQYIQVGIGPVGEDIRVETIDVGVDLVVILVSRADVVVELFDGAGDQMAARLVAVGALDALHRRGDRGRARRTVVDEAKAFDFLHEFLAVGRRAAASRRFLTQGDFGEEVLAFDRTGSITGVGVSCARWRLLRRERGSWREDWMNNA